MGNRRRRWLIAGMLTCLGACSSTPVTVQPSPLWPFQQFDVGAGEVHITSFYSRPEAAPRQLVVVVQSPPCAELRDSALFAQTISTSGVLWRQLKQDSAFLQFDQVGPRKHAATPASDCAESFSIDDWNSQSAMTVEAVRRHEGLRQIATLYVGAGEGAHVAARLAATDANAGALILINGSGLDRHFEEIVRALRNRQATGPDLMPAADNVRSSIARDAKLSTRLPVLIVHAGADERAPVESAALLYSQLVQSGRNASLLVLDAYAHDLNLASDNPDCFEAAMQLIVARTRTMVLSPDSGRGRVERTDCVRAMREFPDVAATTNPR